MEKQILDEEYLSSEFKFGFELEAIFKDAYIYDDPDGSEKLDKDQVEEVLKNVLGKAFDINPEDVNVKRDGSVKSDAYLSWEDSYIDVVIEQLWDSGEYDDASDKELEAEARRRVHDSEIDYDPSENDDYDYPFEWASPIMEFTPTNLKKCIDGLREITNQKKHYNYIYTNSTCGFHTHLSFPHITDKDVIWIISKLAVDDKMKDQVLKFRNMKFYNEEYASKEWLEALETYIRHKQYNLIGKYFDTNKYRNIRIHPQGSIEWRGPREFTKSYNLIKNYFMFLHDFVRWIAKTQSETEINGISKEEYFKNLYNDKQNKEGKMIPDFNKEKAYDKIKDKLSKDMKKSKSTLLAHMAEMGGVEKIRSLMNHMAIDNDDFFKYINKNIEYAIDNNMKSAPLIIYQAITYSFYLNEATIIGTLSEKSIDGILKEIVEYDFIDIYMRTIIKGLIKNYEKGINDNALRILPKYFKYLPDEQQTKILLDNPYILNIVYKTINPQSLHKSVILTYIIKTFDDSYNITEQQLLEICSYDYNYAKLFYDSLVSMLSGEMNMSDEFKAKTKNLIAKVANLM